MNTINELRAMAEEVLARHPRSLNADEWGGNFKKLLEELNIYQIELEHQNTELARSEREVAKAHEEYVRLFESTPVGYVILDETHRIVRVNQTFISYFVSASIQSAQLEGKCFDAFIVDEFKNAFSLFCKMALKQKIPVPIELKLLDRHMNPHYVLLTARIYDPERKLIALTASDISMQKRMEEQLARSKDEAEEADRRKSRFLTNVSHELRTPLATIIGYGALMDDPQISDAEKQDFYRNIVITSKMLMRFSDDVLDVSTLESGETPLRCQIVNMEKLCTEITHLMSRKVIGKNVLLVARTVDVPILWTDRLRISQIIHSVLEHAVGNATEGEILLTCSYNTSGDDACGRLVMNFTGKEIFSAQNDFEENGSHVPVSRAYSSLGLFLTQRIVKAMKGVMVWEHPLDRLRIELPVEVSPYREEKILKTAPDAPAPTPTRKCLLVDDVAMNLKVLALMVKKLGWDPTLAMSGAEALELVKTNKYEMIMTDLWMPEMNGEEMTMTLRQNPDLDDVPIFAVTADVENTSNFNMDFFDGTMIKPVKMDTLEKILSKQEHHNN